MEKDYKEFCDNIKQYMERRFPPDKYKVELHSVMKNNAVKYESMIIHAEGSNISPNFYLNTLYAHYKEGESLQEIARKISEKYYETIQDGMHLQIDFSLEECREKIVFRIISEEKNRELLKTIPHIICLDLAIVFYVVVCQNEDEVGSFRISEQLLKSWKLDEEELFLLARKNTRRLFPVEIYNMYSMLEKMLHVGQAEEELEDYIFDEFFEGKINAPLVVTNKSKINGAAVIFYDGILEKLSDILEGDFYLLPSSVHEMLAIGCSKNMKPETLRKMVIDVNRECVLADEVLSENVYIYHAEDKTIKICI